MKVLKVIVDRLPENCWDCPFPWGGSDPSWQCSIMEMQEGSKNPEDWDIKMDTRPDWCPLMTMKRLLKLWEYAETGNWDYESDPQ